MKKMRWDCCWCKFQLIYRFPLMVVNDNIIYFASKTDQAMKNVLCVSWQIRPLLCTVLCIFSDDSQCVLKSMQALTLSYRPLCLQFYHSVLSSVASSLDQSSFCRDELDREARQADRAEYYSSVRLSSLSSLSSIALRTKYHTNICRAWLWWWDQNWNLNTDCEAGSELSQSWPVI